MGQELSQTYEFRMMHRGDIPELLSIEKSAFRLPWDRKRFFHALNVRNGCTCIVLERALESAACVAGGETSTPPKRSGKKEPLAGYFVVEFHRIHTRIINLAIHQEHRRRGLASRSLSFIDKLARRAAEIADPRDPATEDPARKYFGEIHLEVEESNLAAHLLYKKMGYLATGVLRNFYPLLEEDGYKMVRQIPVSHEQAGTQREEASFDNSRTGV